uniref:NTF2-related export protein n=1 Tax=Paramoeba aestuarina TaxID=180227 RepID=A0A7S4JVQ7_9EUKA
MDFFLLQSPPLDNTPPIIMDMDKLAQEFVQYYYNVFEQNQGNLASLYRDQSMLTFEKKKVQGAQNIAREIQNLGFGQSQHKILTLDCQPFPPGNGVIVFVSGQLKITPTDNPMMFSQVFTLFQEDGNWFVLNDIFKLNMEI